MTIIMIIMIITMMEEDVMGEMQEMEVDVVEEDVEVIDIIFIHAQFYQKININGKIKLYFFGLI